MSVVGFDVGNYTSYIGIARSGGLEVLTNEFSERHNPSYISINGRERLVGQSARQQEINHLKNTFRSFKRMIGRTYSDPIVQRELQFLPFDVFTDKDDNILVKAQYDGKETHFTPHQLYAMMLSKLMSITLTETGQRTIDCVLSCPSYATDLERRAIKEAAQVAGLNCMRLMNDTAAVALNYCMYKPGLPEEKESPVNVAFVDLGFSSLQVCIVAIQKTKCKTLGVSFDSCLGCRDFDYLISEYFANDIRKRFNGYEINHKSRAGLRLLVQCERVKKMMSTISTPVPIDVECLLDGNDYHGTICRETFDELSVDILTRAKTVMENAIVNSGLNVDQIDSVEIVGGGTRVPSIKSLVKEVFKRDPTTTLNADEAVARGCTLMCAILSPAFRVRQVQMSDLQPFPITISWRSQDNDDTAREVFTCNDNFPLTKMIRVNRPSTNSMEIEARYTYPNNIPFGEPLIGYFNIDGINPDQKDFTKLKFRVRINSDGIFEMKQPQLFDQPVEVNTEEDNGGTAVQDSENAAGSDKAGTECQTETTDALLDNEAQADAQMEADNPDIKETGSKLTNIPIQVKDTQKSSTEKPSKKVNAKSSVKAPVIDLNIVSRLKQLTRDQLIHLQEIEVEMLDIDRREKEKADSRNAIEEFIYDMRDKINSTFIEFATADQKSSILKTLDSHEDWLLNDADTETDKSEYDKRLGNLKGLTAGIVKRHKEYTDRPRALDALEKSLRDIIASYNIWFNGDERMSHLTKEDMTKVHNSLQQAKNFHDCVVEESKKSTQLYTDFKYSVREIDQTKTDLENVSLPIIRRPKPPPKEPAPATKPPENKNSPPNENPEQSEQSKSANSSTANSSDKSSKDNSIFEDANIDVE